ncbi:GNAT family N-acetyltransferase [Methanolobus sediminis]|uniref:GNAT family N-acetyltransferase n=1 Tax=Methanolobus sediminis TaxID=3072978 RepID=A0AA51UKT9_9EURY|nr:GNAT family N-acetyltransferase [Methanolobus sediminis]WMW23810.1 GNAT family N-acetyltransferase [Methanolobus sediminis]
MINIRPFREEDNDALLNIEKLCPQGNEEYAMVIDKGPDITARYELYDNWEIRVAEKDATAVGWIGWTIKQGTDEPYLYIAEVMVHPDHRRQGIAVELVREAERAAAEVKASHIYSYVYEPNEAFMNLFDKMGYMREKNIQVISMSAYKKEDVKAGYELERINPEDIHEAVKLLNDYYHGNTHFTPFSTESFRDYAEKILGYGLENFIVAKWKGHIVACAGLWDTSVLMEVTYTKEPMMWKFMTNTYGILRHFVSMPRIPGEGEVCKLHSIVDHAFEQEHSHAMEDILKYCNNLMYDTNCEFFGAYTDPDDPIIGIMKKFKPMYEKLYLYAKPISGKVPDFNRMHVDCRDTIL